MYLELGIMPAKFVIMEKCLNVETKQGINDHTSLWNFKARKQGDVIDLVKQDLIDPKIDMREEDIMNISKVQWNKFDSSYIKELALEHLIEENSTKKHGTSHLTNSSKQKHCTFKSDIECEIRNIWLKIPHTGDKASLDQCG